MANSWKKLWPLLPGNGKDKFGRVKKSHEIDPDEVLIDASNLPHFDTLMFEGRLEKPIKRSTLAAVGIFFLLIASVFIFQAIQLQIVKGDFYLEKSEKNLLRPVPIFAGRGVIYDRNNILLAWNAPSIKVESASNASSTISLGRDGSGDTETENRSVMSGEDAVAVRKYATTTGLAHLLGYVQYPSKDKNGFYYQDDFIGIAGVEKYFDSVLQGNSGSRLVEVDARGSVISENIVRPPAQGKSITLSIDSRVQSALHNSIKDIATKVGFEGGSGVIIDVNTGEVLAMTNYPEYGSQVMSDRNDTAAIKSLLKDKKLPFLNRAVDGLYTPGSIVKPIMALAALNENIIDANTVIVTTGSIAIPNPYDSTKQTVFKDWKNLGHVDMRKAIAMSSDAYFYTIGGGYKDQKGLGISLIDKYLNMFGYGTTTLDGSTSFLYGKAGTIPTPEWKKKTFNESWFLGNTYHTVIGQYGFQVTVMQVARAVAAMANKGTVLTPTIIKGDSRHVESVINVPKKYFDVVHEGMRMSVQQGTSVALNVPYVQIAGKSGTAELGITKSDVNSWITGFWPYEKPKYAFAVMLERGSVHNLIGAAAAMRQTIDWMNVHTPEYFQQ